MAEAGSQYAPKSEVAKPKGRFRTTISATWLAHGHRLGQPIRPDFSIRCRGHTRVWGFERRLPVDRAGVPQKPDSLWGNVNRGRTRGATAAPVHLRKAPLARREATRGEITFKILLRAAHANQRATCPIGLHRAQSLKITPDFDPLAPDGTLGIVTRVRGGPMQGLISSSDCEIITQPTETPRRPARRTAVASRVRSRGAEKLGFAIGALGCPAPIG